LEKKPRNLSHHFSLNFPSTFLQLFLFAKSAVNIFPPHNKTKEVKTLSKASEEQEEKVEGRKIVWQKKQESFKAIVGNRFCLEVFDIKTIFVGKIRISSETAMEISFAMNVNRFSIFIFDYREAKERKRNRIEL
jgi:hypothetical protein